MNDVLNTIFTAVITLAVTIVSPMIVQAAQKAANALAAKTENETIDRICAEIPKVVSNAVDMTFQTYVEALKKSNAFDKTAQETALKMALEACLNSLSQSAKDYINNSTSGDINGYLTTCIEAEVKRQKIPTLTPYTASI